MGVDFYAFLTSRDSNCLSKTSTYFSCVLGKCTVFRCILADDVKLRVEPPTLLAPSLSLSIPASTPVTNIIRHIFSITCSFSSQTLSIRLLSPLESPSATTLSNDTASNHQSSKNMLMNVCADFISDIGRLKRTGMGWEEKTLFLKFHAGKTNR